MSLDKTIFLLVLVLMIYGGLMVQLLKGAREYRCRYTDKPLDNQEVWPVVEGADYLCGYKECPEGTFCRSTYDFGMEFEYIFV